MARTRGRLALLGFWLLPALVATLGLGLVPSRANPDLTLAEAFLVQAIFWFSWGLWSLVILAVGDRFPFESGRIGRALVAHVALYLVVLAIQILLVTEVSVRFGLSQRRELESILFIGIRVYGDVFTVVFWAIVGARIAFRWQASWREEAARSARLSHDLVRAQLETLRSQLNPHFLFNALNSIVTLIGRDPSAAQRMVVRLGDLLRATLATGDAQEIPAEQELEITGRYLEIEQIRFADRLTVAWEIGPGVAEALVPAFALQPLVENAIIHGVSRLTRPGKVVVRAFRRDGAMVFEVADDGPGPMAPPQPGRSRSGVGLSNLRSRLEGLYGGQASLVVREGPDGGALVELTVPERYRTAGAATAAPDSDRARFARPAGAGEPEPAAGRAPGPMPAR